MKDLGALAWLVAVFTLAAVVLGAVARLIFVAALFGWGLFG